jgi:hypothetical protein
VIRAPISSRLRLVARRLLIVVAFFALLAIAGSACKQQEGERCQTDEDCEGSLICNQATQECSTAAGGGIDATTPEFIDADDIDAPDDAIDAP